MAYAKLMREAQIRNEIYILKNNINIKNKFNNLDDQEESLKDKIIKINNSSNSNNYVENISYYEIKKEKLQDYNQISNNTNFINKDVSFNDVQEILSICRRNLIDFSSQALLMQASQLISVNAVLALLCCTSKKTYD